jgi:hypothetical protein
MHASTSLLPSATSLDLIYNLLLDAEELDLELEGSVGGDDWGETSGTVGYLSVDI